MFYVKVNATSANVCVGFDVLGLALDISNTFSFKKSGSFSFKGFEAPFMNKNNNIVYSSYVEVFKQLNKNPIPVEIGFKGEIPVSRGLGSSSSLIVAGVFAANYILGNPLSTDELFNISAKIEGHPDNVAPAVYGNLVASYKKGDCFKAVCYPISEELKYAVIIPPFKLSTHMSRSVLPSEQPYENIVHNMSRIVNIPRALALGDVELLADLFDDRLHEPYRAKLISGYEEIKNICLKNKAAFAISGSGSTMIAISKDLSFVKELSSFGYEVRTPAIGSGVKIWEE